MTTTTAPGESAAALASQLLDELRDDPAVLAAADAALRAELERRGIYFGDGLLPTYPVPFFAPAPALAGWQGDSESLAAVVEEVAQAALADPALVRSLHLRDDARAWIEIDPGYPTISVLARPDAVFIDGAVRYVEYNSDSPAMMAFSDHVSECLLSLPYLRAHAARLRGERMLPQLYETLLDCYRSYGGTGAPTIAIVDWPGQKTRFEHARIAEYFESRGAPSLICDPRELSRPGRHLEYQGRRVDLVYRRALFTELLDREREVQPLISAYRDGAVCMVNPLRSYLASSKTLLAFLCERWPAARGACPVLSTRVLGPARIAELRAHDQKVVLKKGESHGGLHVLLPGIGKPEDRHAALDDAERSPWVEQDYVELPRLRFPARGAPNALRYYNWNPFLFGGRYAGAIARASETPLINITLGGGLLPTIVIDEPK
jgi:glutathionylspermidine synthase